MLITIIALCIIFTVIFFSYDLTKMIRYIYTLTEKYTSFLANYSNIQKLFPPRKNIKNKSSRIEIVNYSKDININKNNLHKKKKQSSVRIGSKVQNTKNLLFSLSKRQSQLMSEKEKIGVSQKFTNIEEGKKIKKYFKEYLETSPDDMEFDDAIKRDKRGFCRYFLDNLKQNQNLAYTFIASDRINTRMIKFILFLLNIALYFVVCGLFFSEAYISELYHINEKKENFFSFIPRTIDKVIYTTIVGVFISYLTSFFLLRKIK